MVTPRAESVGIPSMFFGWITTNTPNHCAWMSLLYASCSTSKSPGRWTVPLRPRAHAEAGLLSPCQPSGHMGIGSSTERMPQFAVPGAPETVQALRLLADARTPAKEATVITPGCHRQRCLFR